MPNAKVLSEKQAIVAELTEKLKTASSGVLVDYKGITVAQDTALRAECRKNELDYAVVKNTLVRFAINNVGLEEMDSVLNGTTSLALSHGDPIAPMRVINKFAKQFNGEKFTIKAGFMDGKVLSLDEIKALANLLMTRMWERWDHPWDRARGMMRPQESSPPDPHLIAETRQVSHDGVVQLVLAALGAQSGVLSHSSSL